MKVIGLRESQWDKDGETVTTYWVTLEREDGKAKEVPAYDAKAADLVNGEPLPEGWEVRQSKAGKDYLAPPKGRKDGAFKVAYRNTKEGQAFEQQQMNRRTALMQAIALNSSQGKSRAYDQTLHEADAFFRWLEASSVSEEVVSSRERSRLGKARSVPSSKGVTSSEPISAAEANQDPPDHSTAAETSAPTPPVEDAAPGGVGASSTDELWLEARRLIGNTGQVVKYAAKLLNKSVSTSKMTAADLEAVIAAKRGEAA